MERRHGAHSASSRVAIRPNDGPLFILGCTWKSETRMMPMHRVAALVHDCQLCMLEETGEAGSHFNCQPPAFAQRLANQQLRRHLTVRGACLATRFHFVATFNDKHEMKNFSSCAPLREGGSQK